ncbi:MAG TPA: HAD family hydrolase [Acidimicrobiales bacterium]|nr:HAD family hydrolase [Acidimicrobiales bacterium]
MAIEAVTFDYWNTLVVDSSDIANRRIDSWLGILEDAGFAVEREALHLEFAANWQRFVDHWNANQQYDAAMAAETILESLGHRVPDAIQESLVEAFVDAGNHTHLELTAGVADTLATLHAAGIRIGIICDVGFTPSTILRAHLERFGVIGLFDHWSFSDEVGVYKPSPVIFDHALAGLGGVDPSVAAHVGDLRRTDVAGALAKGMTAVRYAGQFDDDSADHPEAHHVIRHHAELPGVLAI